MVRMLAKKGKGNDRGFTLLETVISLAVFSIGILGIATLQNAATQSNTLSLTVQNNTNWAVAQTEEFMAADYGDQRIANSGTFYDSSPDNKYNFNFRVWDGRANPDVAIPNAKLVQVTSQFTQNGRPRTITVRCFKPFVQ